ARCAVCVRRAMVSRPCVHGGWDGAPAAAAVWSEPRSGSAKSTQSRRFDEAQNRRGNLARMSLRSKGNAVSPVRRKALFSRHFERANLAAVHDEIGAIVRHERGGVDELAARRRQEDLTSKSRDEPEERGGAISVELAGNIVEEEDGFDAARGADRGGLRAF